MTSPLRRKRPTTASVWRSSTDALGTAIRPLAAGLLIVSLLGLNLPQAVADSYDSSKPAGWSARTQTGKSKTAVARPTSAGLKWRGQASIREPARSVPHHAKPIPQAAPAKARQAASPSIGPALAAPQVSRALHKAENETKDDIQLTSLTAPADDPFQDELTDDEMVGDEEADDSEVEDAGYEEESSDEEDSEDAPGADFDDMEVAQRDAIDELSQPSDEPEFDIRTQLPRLGEEYAQAGPNEPERCPSPRDLKPINQIDNRIAAEPGLFPQECALSEEAFQPRQWPMVTFTWKASCLAHKPLWFQQPKLERYGHTFGPVLTPIISAGHFFVMIPCLPYNMGLEPPWECVYALGWYRPGDCAPYTLGPLPLSLQAAGTQAVITTGLWFLFP